MSEWIIGFLIGVLTGILSGFGIGGGSLLLIYLTAFVGMAQQKAQGINLIYFLPAALAALPFHIKNNYVDKKTVLFAVLIGLCCSALAAWLSNNLEMTVMRKLFCVFLLLIGLSELFRKTDAKKEEIL